MVLLVNKVENSIAAASMAHRRPETTGGGVEEVSACGVGTRLTGQFPVAPPTLLGSLPRKERVGVNPPQKAVVPATLSARCHQVWLDPKMVTILVSNTKSTDLVLVRLS
jgi:hypothetical protein